MIKKIWVQKINMVNFQFDSCLSSSSQCNITSKWARNVRNSLLCISNSWKISRKFYETKDKYLLPIHFALRASQNANPLFFPATFFKWVDYICYHHLITLSFAKSKQSGFCSYSPWKYLTTSKNPRVEGILEISNRHLFSTKQREEFNSFKDYLFHFWKSVSSLFWFKAHNTHPPIISKSAQKSLIIPHDSSLF